MPPWLPPIDPTYPEDGVDPPFHAGGFGEDRNASANIIVGAIIGWAVGEILDGVSGAVGTAVDNLAVDGTGHGVDPLGNNY